jgi:flagellin
MIIGSSLSSSNALTNLQASQILSQSQAQLASGEDLLSAGSATSDTTSVSLLDTQLSDLDSTQQEVGSAISFTQTQDGYLQNVSTALQGMGELAQLAADPNATDAERAGYQSEYSQLGASISNIASQQFNGVGLFSGSSVDVPLDSENSTLTLSGVDLAASPYTDAIGASLSSASAAQDALGKVNSALTQLSEDQAGVGSNLSQLNTAADQVVVSKENLNAAGSTIQDSDAAEALAQFAQQSILSQPSDALLAQANATPQSALLLSP